MLHATMITSAVMTAGTSSLAQMYKFDFIKLSANICITVVYSNCKSYNCFPSSC